MKDRIK